MSRCRLQHALLLLPFVAIPNVAAEDPGCAYLYIACGDSISSEALTTGSSTNFFLPLLTPAKLTISTCSPSTTITTNLELYSSCPATSTAGPLATQVPDGFDECSVTYYDAHDVGSYYIQVVSTSAVDGSFGLTLTCDTETPLPPVSLAGAVPTPLPTPSACAVQGVLACPSASVTGSTSPGFGNYAGNAAPEVYLGVAVMQESTIEITTCNAGLNTFIAVLHLYRACPHVPEGSVASLPIATSTENEASFPHCALLRWDVHPSEIGSYWLMVEGKAQSVGQFQVDLTCREGRVPTWEPTPQPSPLPTLQPTAVPTLQPSSVPTPNPTMLPTPNPTMLPTPQPSALPTLQPSSVPTPQPTSLPTPQPSALPTFRPSSVPVPSPSSQPTPIPSRQPTPVPSSQPTMLPTPWKTNSCTRTFVALPDCSRAAGRHVGVLTPGDGNATVEEPFEVFALDLQRGQRLTASTCSTVTNFDALLSVFERCPGRAEEDGAKAFVVNRHEEDQGEGCPSLTFDALETGTIYMKVQKSSVHDELEADFGLYELYYECSSYPTAQPTALPTPQPSSAPTQQPSSAPTPQPSSAPTPLPTQETPRPTPLPTTREPTPTPTPDPTHSLPPSPLPTAQPTPLPTNEPTPLPTPEPSPLPTEPLRGLNDCACMSDTMVEQIRAHCPAIADQFDAGCITMTGERLQELGEQCEGLKGTYT